MGLRPVRAIQLRIPFATLIKVALFLLLVFAIIRLLPLIAILYVAAMLAVVMAAATMWLQEHRLPRRLALTLVSIALFGSVLMVLFAVVPATVSELRGLGRELPKISERLQQRVPSLAPYIRNVTAQAKADPQQRNTKAWVGKGAIAGVRLIEALTALFLTLVISIYFVVEGRRALAWIFSFAPQRQREKLRQTTGEAEPIMLAYMRGQLITSTLAAGVSLAALLPFGVPAAVPLAVLAFVGDFVPVLGFLAAIIPAVLLALLVSPMAALTVILAYSAYHLVESYWIVPRVYGRAMRMSTLTVLIAVTVGGILGGPAGAVLILPIVAVYPAVERIWLRDRLPPDTIPRHDAIEGNEGSE